MLAGTTAFALTTTPISVGQLFGFFALTIRLTSPLESISATYPCRASATTPEVSGIPAVGRTTAWVIGLSGTVGLKRTGRAVRGFGVQRSAVRSGGQYKLGCGTVPSFTEGKVSPWSASTTLP